MDGNFTSHALCMITTQNLIKNHKFTLISERVRDREKQTKIWDHHSHALSINDHDSIFKMSKYKNQIIFF